MVDSRVGFWVALPALVACTEILGDDFVIQPGNGEGGATMSTGGGGATSAAGGAGGGGGMGGIGGTGGSVQMMCEAGTADCNNIAADGCEVILASDPSHCGMCSHDCLGGTCDAEVCRAVQLAMGTASDFPRSIVVDAANVYWANESAGNVMRVPLGGGAPVNLGFGQPAAYGVTVDATHVYWSRRASPSGAIGRVPIGGGGPLDFVTSVDGPEDMANDATHIFWGTFRGGIGKYPKGGGAREMLATSLGSPSRIALHDTWVYTTNYFTGGVYRVSKDNGALEQLHSDTGGPLGVDADASGVYWVSFLGNEVWHHDPVTSTDNMLATANAPRDIVVDDTFAYYSESGANRVMRVRKDGNGTAEVFAEIAQNAPRGITHDDVAVYWTNVDGTVWKRAKDP